MKCILAPLSVWCRSLIETFISVSLYNFFFYNSGFGAVLGDLVPSAIFCSYLTFCKCCDTVVLKLYLAPLFFFFKYVEQTHHQIFQVQRKYLSLKFFFYPQFYVFKESLFLDDTILNRRPLKCGSFKDKLLHKSGCLVQRLKYSSSIMSESYNSLTSFLLSLNL